MCGIAGMIGTSAVVDVRDVVRMTHAMRHRGPDDEGYLAFELESAVATPLSGADSRRVDRDARSFARRVNVCLGHRRLSILDLSDAGHQPMRSAGGSWIVYNGEIYNYIELRSELGRMGHRFTTGTDTEVLLAAYEAWGDACVERFDGMWAFVILDTRASRLFASRDRLGVKPFYYRLDPTSSIFAFSSEIKPLLMLGPVDVNQPLAWDYLVLGHLDHSSETLFAGIHKLPAGANLVRDLTTGATTITRYYSLRVDHSDSPFDERKAAAYSDELVHEVRRSVKLRLRSDVDVGSCASGGIDSSILACLAAELRRADGRGEGQHLFTAAYQDWVLDESKFAAAVARDTGAEWHVTRPTAEGLYRDLDDLVRTQEEPFGSTSIYAQYCVMREAGQAGVRVLLDGQGADELYGGYLPYVGERQWELLRRRRYRAFAEHTHAVTKRYSAGVATRGFLRAAAFGTAPVVVLRAARHAAKPLLARMLNPDFIETHRERWSQYQRHNRSSSLNGALANRIEGPGLQALLRYEDRNSMRWAVEGRTPFADDFALVDAAFSIPSAYKTHDAIPKYLLRRAFDAMLPVTVARRRDKVGFATPERSWLTQLWPELTGRLRDLPADDCIRLDFAQRAGGMRAIAEQGDTSELWRLLNYSLWRHAFAASLR